MQFRQNSAEHQSIDYLIAADPETESRHLGSMAAASTCKRLLEYIAENESTPFYTLAKLSSHEDHDIRMAVGRNHKAPFAVIEKLAEDDHPDVRFSLAENPNLPAEILDNLALDENPWVASRASSSLERALQEAKRKSAEAEVIQLIDFLAGAPLTGLPFQPTALPIY